MLKFYFNLLSSILLISFVYSIKSFYGEPEQIHLSYGATPDKMIVTWITMDPVNVSVVEYGTDSINLTQYDTNELFVDGGVEKRKLTVHRVILSNLVPGQVYSTI